MLHWGVSIFATPFQNHFVFFHLFAVLKSPSCEILYSRGWCILESNSYDFLK